MVVNICLKTEVLLHAATTLIVSVFAVYNIAIVIRHFLSFEKGRQQYRQVSQALFNHFCHENGNSSLNFANISLNSALFLTIYVD